ncbi:hypothetical protein [Caviibacter abscessus]|uniref:hypothetical protein n=1 Tax=Caviibacter abscessus TaxID=1766719 RepID=UPI000833D1BD|nr:hypothetical protein [Caviibacter abscessus]
MRDIEYLCNKVIIINDGKKIYQDSLVELKKIYGKEKLCICELIETENVVTFAEGLLSKGQISEYTLEKNTLKIVLENDIEKELILNLFKHFKIANIKFEEVSIDNIVKKFM